MRLFITLALSIFVLMSCEKDNFTTDKKEEKKGKKENLLDSIDSTTTRKYLEKILRRRDSSAEGSLFCWYNSVLAVYCFSKLLR